ncbi:TonB-dependent receptor [Phenylobacterium sp. J426]|uniref:TonB-dependent receptor n=1 Tax=Phenylobacterium sp. J426 TaxID=2898439 RepID=UPI002150E450|nr:TonB-dependent receptor [Phenylobacterium sp. J426]MCR5873703.1 TonB-dependent receptor [Phenylobacterium sp. J426]
MAWAAGAQYRYTQEIRKYGEFFNSGETPCPDRPACADESGPLQFFGSAVDRDDDANVKAIFAEVQVPVLENLNLNFAIRHEDYQGGIGSTTNPKVAAKWQVTDFLAPARQRQYDVPRAGPRPRQHRLQQWRACPG